MAEVLSATLPWLRKQSLGGHDDRHNTVFDYNHDANGNLLGETASRHFEWDHSDRMRVFRTQTGSAEPSVHAHYLYDGGGQRVKKLVRKQGGQFATTVYIDGIFEHHRTVQGGATRENNTLHVMDDETRIAVIRVGAPFPDDSTPAVQVPPAATTSAAATWCWTIPAGSSTARNTPPMAKPASAASPGNATASPGKSGMKRAA